MSASLTLIYVYEKAGNATYLPWLDTWADGRWMSYSWICFWHSRSRGEAVYRTRIPFHCTKGHFRCFKCSGWEGWAPEYELWNASRGLEFYKYIPLTAMPYGQAMALAEYLWIYT